MHTVHRVSALVLGAFLCVFGVLGFARGQPFFSTEGSVVLGLSSNGLLAAISVLVGLVLIGSAALGGNAASTISLVIGGLFVLSGMANSMVLGTDLNVLAFRMPNILFSLAVGAVLLITGGWGRLTGGLPDDNPYHADPVPSPETEAEQDHWPAALSAELAEAERAYALHYATPEQLRRLDLVHRYRSPADRRRIWQDSAPPQPPDSVTPAP